MATPRKKSAEQIACRKKTVGKIKSRQAKMLLDMSRQITSVDSLDEILETVVELTSQELGAERSTLFLHDRESCELYSHIAQGDIKRKIRIMDDSGIAGHVFSSGESLIVHDAYGDERFMPDIDRQTGFKTRNILCCPIKTSKGKTIGAIQVLNKKKGQFCQEDMILLEAMIMQATVALQSALLIEQMQEKRRQEMKFLDCVAELTSEINLSTLLQKVMGEATSMLHAERSTLFLNDEKTNELWSEVGEGIGATEIRFPNHMGIAGAVFTSGQSVNIPHAYADLRFNPAFDKTTGFFTRSILCVPVINKKGKIIGVTQVLNKRGGPFSDEDESRLKAFTAQVSIALENANLFKEVQSVKNYNESMFESMTNGVITLNEEGEIVTCNTAGYRIFGMSPEDILDRPAVEFFTGANGWIMEKISRIEETNAPEHTIDAELSCSEGMRSINLTVQPLYSEENTKIGTLLMIEDISSEKRMKSTMSRYMDPGLTDKLLEGDEDILGGISTTATILFSDIRGFTSLTEELGAQGTVSLLNEYFTIMVDCIQREEGMLDKFIGDAIMAAFGIPIAHKDDEDRAVRAAIAMISELQKWNRYRANEGKKPLDMGIGLNTDTIVSGNIGSPKRMDYTMIGDGVNLAARLESACKKYSSRILISENTFKNLHGTYRIRDIDDVVVKGKSEAVRIYEVLDYHSEEFFPNLMEVVSHFKEGRHYYGKGKWEKAIKSFQRALKLHPDDKLSNIYIERCQYLQENPPPGDWNGVWVMQTK
ncbi:MAG: GAF domain-containing protein [Deltaproteobacteria bacterium]|jgi:adenylate cyclase|nr:GAF domain-containing protein [Deltaproteobacteria bacterium]